LRYCRRRKDLGYEALHDYNQLIGFRIRWHDRQAHAVFVVLRANAD
jgi:hypothetical protein